MTSITGENIQRFQLHTQIRAVQLEQMGMKHSGGNITPKLKSFYKLPRTATHEQVIEKLKHELEKMSHAD